jgi:hypothetical protein
MNTYIVSGTITVSCWTLVEADSDEEAVNIASGREIAQFQIDYSYEDSEFFHIDSDGTPQNLRAEKT